MNAAENELAGCRQTLARCETWGERQGGLRRHYAVVILGSLRVLERGQAGALHGVVRLEDVSLADAPSRSLATTFISLAAGVSEDTFRLVVDPDPDPKRSYLVSAVLDGEEVTTGRRRVFGTTIAHPWTPNSTDSLIVEVRSWD
jgi:hypothetical protein